MGDWYLNLVVVAAFIVGGIGFPVVFELRRAWRRPREWSLHTKVTLATTALLLFGGAVGTATFLLTWFDPNLPAVDLLFEAASAFGTVGMSTGLTPELSAPSRVLIIVLMFVGRVGPITFGTAVLLRPQQQRYGYASEGLTVG